MSNILYPGHWRQRCHTCGRHFSQDKGYLHVITDISGTFRNKAQQMLKKEVYRHYTQVVKRSHNNGHINVSEAGST